MTPFQNLCVLAIFRLISHVILHRTTPTSIFAQPTSHISSKHHTWAVYIVSYTCYEMQVAYFARKSWYRRYAKKLSFAIFSRKNAFLATPHQDESLNPPLQRPGIRLINSHSFQIFNYFWKILVYVDILRRNWYIRRVCCLFLWVKQHRAGQCSAFACSSHQKSFGHSI